LEMIIDKMGRKSYVHFRSYYERMIAFYKEND